MFRLFVATTIAALGAVAAVAADPALSEGNWRVSQASSATQETRQCLLKVEKKDGKLSATIIDTRQIPVQRGQPPQKLEVKLSAFAVDGDQVRFEMEFFETKYAFEGTVNPKEPKVVRGSLATDRRASRASIERQESEKLEQQSAAERPKTPEPNQQIQRMFAEYSAMMRKVQQSKDVNEKADLQEKAKAMDKEIDAKLPGLYRETVAKHADSPYAIDAASTLIRTAKSNKATPEEVEKWIQIVEADAVRYGPRYVREFCITSAEALRTQKELGHLALRLAHRADKGMSKDSPQFQERVLRALKAIFNSAGDIDHVKAVDDRLAKIAATLDAEYEREVPPFKPTAFAGRKDKSANRPVVMELFTGAQCGPCIASDVAFDALAQAYKATDLILIQYHMHIPGPDPMTSAETVARWDYYREKFPEGIRGTPSTLFNGGPQAGGGGGMSNAKNKYNQFVKVINPLLDEKTEIKLSGEAARNGDKLSISVQANGVATSDKSVLRLLLAEESIKYVGGNGLRVHHQVVREFPGGVAGTPIKDKAAKAKADVNLAELRKKLSDYLDKYAEQNPFPYEDRPMDFSHLKVIALVQNDETGEILSGLQLDVK